MRDEEVIELKRQIDALEKRVKELEQFVNMPSPPGPETVFPKDGVYHL